MQSFIAIHPKVAEIFQSGPKWRIDLLTTEGQINTAISTTAQLVWLKTQHWLKPDRKIPSVSFSSHTNANPGSPNSQWVNVMRKTPPSCAMQAPMKVSHKGRQAGYCFKPLLSVKSINDMDKALRILIKLLTGSYRCTLLFLPGSNQQEGRCTTSSTPVLPHAIA